MSTLEYAAATYEIEKPGMKHRVTMRIIERRLGLRANQLAWYFANMNRRTKQKNV